MPDLLQRNKQLARMYPEDIATDGDLDRLEDLLAADYIEHGPFGQESHGPAEDRAQMEAFREAFSDFEAHVDEVIAEGDLVAMRLTLSGTHTGGFMGIPATGQAFEIQNMVFTRLEDGKIAERWVHPDTLGLFQQLGVIEAPAP